MHVHAIIEMIETFCKNVEQTQDFLHLKSY